MLNLQFQQLLLYVLRNFSASAIAALSASSHPTSHFVDRNHSWDWTNQIPETPRYNNNPTKMATVLPHTAPGTRFAMQLLKLLPRCGRGSGTERDLGVAEGQNFPAPALLSFTCKTWVYRNKTWPNFCSNTAPLQRKQGKSLHFATHSFIGHWPYLMKAHLIISTRQAINHSAGDCPSTLRKF